MTIQRMDHVGIIVNDLAAAKEFFVELGLELQGEASLEGGSVDRVVGLEGVRSEIAMLATPDGHARIELSKFHAPSGPAGDPNAPSNAPGIRHVTFEVDDLDAVYDALDALGVKAKGAPVQAERYRTFFTRPETADGVGYQFLSRG